MRRVCLSCGQTTEQAIRGRCRPCHLANERRRFAERPAFERNLYSSGAWQRLRKQVLEEAGHRCHYCGGVATTADHVVTVREAPHLALERGNCVAACQSCQQKRKVRR